MKKGFGRYALSLIFFLTSFSAWARWRDEGQSEKYLVFWEDQYQWEAVSIEGYKLLLDQNYETSEKKLQEAIKLGCPLGKVRFQLGLCLDKLHQPEAAIENYREALKILSTGKEKEIEEYVFLAHHNLGILLLEEGKDEEAVKEFVNATRIRPQDASAYVNLGFLYSKNDMLEKAVEAYQRAINLDPQLALAHYNLGVLLRRLNRAQEAEQHIERAQHLDPALQDIVGSVTETKEIKDPLNLTLEEIQLIRDRAKNAEDLTMLGHLYWARSEFEKALSMYDEAIAQAENFTGAHVGRGQVLLRLGHPEDAQRSIFRALELEPNNVDGHIQLGKIYYDLGRIQMARQEFEKAYAHNPNQVELLFYLGVVNEYAGDVRYGDGFPAQESISYYKKALEIAPLNLQARTNLANVYAKSGDWENAKKEFEQASTDAANSPYAHYNLGYIYDELGLRRQSIEEYLKAVSLDAKFADAYFNLGYVYGEYKLFRLAEKQYYRVLDIDREYADAYFNLAILYDRYLKDKGKAHTYYHEYSLRRPNTPIGERKVLKKRILKLYP